MKKIILFTGLLMVIVTSFSQTSSPTNTDYLKKSRGQNTTAWILLGGGTALTTVGMTVGLNEAINDIGGIGSGQPQKTSSVGVVLFFTGLASMAGSVPFFIASSKNKKKANNVSAFFKVEQQPSVAQGIMIRTPYPALAVKIGIR